MSGRIWGPKIDVAALRLLSSRWREPARRCWRDRARATARANDPTPSSGRPPPAYLPRSAGGHLRAGPTGSEPQGNLNLEVLLRCLALRSRARATARANDPTPSSGRPPPAYLPRSAGGHLRAGPTGSEPQGNLNLEVLLRCLALRSRSMRL